MAHVGFGFAAIERRKVIARSNALGQLAQFGLIELFAQLGLTEQDDLQQFLRRRFQVGEQTHLLQRLGRKVLRLIHNQHHAQTLGVGIEQIDIEDIDQALETAATVADVEFQFLADRLEQFHRRKFRMKHQRDARILGQLFKQQPAQRGLAGADLARELHETAAAALADAIKQMRKRVPVALGQEYVARVGSDRKRRLFEAVKLKVHTDTLPWVWVNSRNFNACRFSPPLQGGGLGGDGVAPRSSFPRRRRAAFARSKCEQRSWPEGRAPWMGRVIQPQNELPLVCSERVTFWHRPKSNQKG